MQAYAAYRRLLNIDFHSICKKTPKIFAYVKNLLYLCTRFR